MNIYPASDWMEVAELPEPERPAHDETLAEIVDSLYETDPVSWHMLTRVGWGGDQDPESATCNYVSKTQAGAEIGLSRGQAARAMRKAWEKVQEIRAEREARRKFWASLKPEQYEEGMARLKAALGVR